MKKLLMILAALCLVSCSLAEGAVTEEKALELGSSRMRFPAVSGMADAELQEEVNRGSGFRFLRQSEASLRLRRLRRG